jgi:hypothetical protein
VDLFVGKGIKSADDTEAIDEMADFIQRALTSIQ